jgi:hypothetical protein
VIKAKGSGAHGSEFGEQNVLHSQTRAVVFMKGVMFTDVYCEIE